MTLLAVREPWNRDVVFLLRDSDGRRVYAGKPIEMVEATPGVHQEPTFRLEETEAQALMDCLWNCGLRPSEGTGSAGAMAATQAHLKDMQSIAMRLLGKVTVQLPDVTEVQR